MESFSLEIQVELTLACVLQCGFCYTKSHSDLWRSGKSLPFEKLKNILDTLHENPPDFPLERLRFVGTGETLLYKQLLEAISCAKRVFPHVSIVTNGVLLTKEMSEKLIDSGVNEILISITGASPEVYARHQGTGKSLDEVIKQYDMVKKNVEDLCRLRNQKKAPLNILTSFILHEGSQKDFARSLNMWRDVGVNGMFFRPMLSPEPLLSDDYEEFISNNSITASCAMFGKSMQIFVNGDLHICSYQQFKQPRLGNAFESSITKLLNSEKFKRLVDIFHRQYMDVPELCKTCHVGRILFL